MSKKSQMSKESQMVLDGFFDPRVKPDYVPTPYIDRDGAVKFACWRTLECKYRQHAKDSLMCVHYVADAHGCTLTGLCITALQRHIRAYRDKLDQLEAEER